MHASNEAPSALPLPAGVRIVINLGPSASKHGTALSTDEPERHPDAPSPVVCTNRRRTRPDGMVLEPPEDLGQQLDGRRLIGHPRSGDQIPALDLRRHQESSVTSRQLRHQGSEEGRHLPLRLDEQIRIVSDDETPSQ